MICVTGHGRYRIIPMLKKNSIELLDPESPLPGSITVNRHVILGLRGHVVTPPKFQLATKFQLAIRINEKGKILHPITTKCQRSHKFSDTS